MDAAISKAGNPSREVAAPIVANGAQQRGEVELLLVEVQLLRSDMRSDSERSEPVGRGRERLQLAATVSTSRCLTAAFKSGG